MSTENSATNPDPQPLRGGGLPAWLVIQGVLVLTWLAAFYSARLLEYAPHASLWFPPAAVAFAGFVVFRQHALPGLFAAACISLLPTAMDTGARMAWSAWLLNATLFAAVHCAVYGLAAAIVLRAIRGAGSEAVMRAVVAFLLGGLLAAFLAGLLGAWVTQLGGMISPAELGGVVMPWMMGDYAGLLALGPLLVIPLRLLARRLRLGDDDHLRLFDGLPQPEPDRGRLLAKLAVMLLSTSGGLYAMSQMPDNEPLLFLVFAAILLQLWIVHTQGALESMLSITLFSTTLAALVAALELGQLAPTLQFIVITLAAATYFGMAVPVLYADNAHLRRLLIHDSLTGAYSRYFFVELGSEALRSASERGEPLSMMMIDLDYLKRINDDFGHASGDRILAGVVRECRQALSKSDLLGRIGGDEFCALLPDTGIEQAEQRAQAVLAALADSELLLPDGSRPSVSVGVAAAAASGEGETFASLSHRADMALYEAKRRGRRGVIRAPD
ncbi:MAG: GGDEF domain-containing protein [Lysobacteraceae bacterium]